ncbi:MAG: hypothetical protein ACRENY_00140 [Candidatus Dormibacteria bacterium]
MTQQTLGRWRRRFPERRLETLEAQLCGWTEQSGDSPDWLDALVWGLTDVIEQSQAAVYLDALTEQAEALQRLTPAQEQMLLLRGFQLQRPGQRTP